MGLKKCYDFLAQNEDNETNQKSPALLSAAEASAAMQPTGTMPELYSTKYQGRKLRSRVYTTTTAVCPQDRTKNHGGCVFFIRPFLTGVIKTNTFKICVWGSSFEDFV